MASKQNIYFLSFWFFGFFFFFFFAFWVLGKKVCCSLILRLAVFTHMPKEVFQYADTHTNIHTHIPNHTFIVLFVDFLKICRYFFDTLSWNFHSKKRTKNTKHNSLLYLSLTLPWFTSTDVDLLFLYYILFFYSLQTHLKKKKTSTL